MVFVHPILRTLLLLLLPKANFKSRFLETHAVLVQTPWQLHTKMRDFLSQEAEQEETGGGRSGELKILQHQVTQQDQLTTSNVHILGAWFPRTEFPPAP